MFPANGAVFPSQSFSPGPMGGQFGAGFGAPLIPGSGFGNQSVPFPSGPQQPPFSDPNQFGSGAYGRPRSRHRSQSRRRRSRSSSSSDDERYHGGSPFAGPGIPYNNPQPYENVPPRPGSPFAGSGMPYNNFQPRSGSPFGGAGIPYNNPQPFPNVQPRPGSPVLPFNNFQPFPNMSPFSPGGGSPVMPQRRPMW
jgi:hypothetical protein